MVPICLSAPELHYHWDARGISLVFAQDFGTEIWSSLAEPESVCSLTDGAFPQPLALPELLLPPLWCSILSLPLFFETCIS